MRRALLPCVVLLLTVGVAPAPAQIPTTYTNLQILPKTITRPDLVAIMRDFAIHLGVRCQHCHVGEEGADFSTFDFATDVKPAKVKARAMLRLVVDVNDQLTTALGPAPGGERRVTCFTCHRGASKPATAPPAGRGAGVVPLAAHGPAR